MNADLSLILLFLFAPNFVVYVYIVYVLSCKLILTFRYFAVDVMHSRVPKALTVSKIPFGVGLSVI